MRHRNGKSSKPRNCLKNAARTHRQLHALLGAEGDGERDTFELALKAFAALQRELPVKEIAFRDEHCEQPTP